ncbi:MAG: TIGR04255 family protein [Acidobacteria bacterium]|nr:TIGR04255 family protein [Acidobacteriota bacterium]MBI3471760.1 TIGR04255 family protein [Candidatus Solibacter usitatus]
MVTARPDDLPDFENPPVVETVLSVQFELLTAVRTAHLGLLWEKFRARFPKAEDRPPLDSVFEQFPEVPRPRLGLQLQTFERPPVPRLWFVTDQGNEMIQVQPDRFVKNWRKEGQGEQYPRYEAGKRFFERDFAVFQEFLAENRLGTPRVNQCEVTYVNHITAGEGWQDFSDFEQVFSFWKLPAGDIPGNGEDFRAHVRFIIPGGEGRPAGRLHVDVQPAFRTSDSRPMYVFHLTARGQVGESLGFFDLGRRWIVKSFAALTTPSMHEVWKRKESRGNV